MKKAFYFTVIALLLLAGISSVYKNNLYPLFLFAHSYVSADRSIMVGSECLDLPMFWWVNERKSQKQMIVVRVTSDREQPLLALFFRPYDENLISTANLQGEGEEEPMKRYLMAEENGLYDIFWLFPSKGLMVAGYKYRSYDHSYAEEVINALGACN